MDETLVAHALRGEWFDASEDGTGRGTRIVPICFDETQITHPANRSNPQPGEPSHALAKGARPPMIAFSCKDHGADATDDLAPTMRAMPHSDSHPNAGGQLAVAFDLRGRLGGSQFEGPHDTANIRAASGGSSRSYVLAPDDTLLHNGVRQKGDANGREIEGNAAQVLRAMREEIGAEAFTQWGLGILDSLQPEEVLRPLVHGRELRLPGSEAGPELDDGASSRAEACSAGLMREMWEAGCERRSPQGWEPSEQRAREFAAALSLLSHEGAQSEAIMLAMWEASEGLRILREALSALQKIRRPAVNEDQSAHSRWEVRRLTPVECERLMGVPDDYTRIPWRGKPAEQCPDGPRYKALGNSWAVPVVRWIGERLAAQLEAR